MIWNDEHAYGQRDPLMGLREIQREMERMFNGYAAGGTAYPLMNVWGDDHELHIAAELPGVEPSDVEINVEENVLHLSGERKPHSVEAENSRHLSETAYGAFDRSLRLPFEVDVEKVKAQYRNGMLHITLPRVTPARPIRIEVQS